MPWIGRASTQLQSAKLIDGPTFNKDGWLKLEYVYFVKMPLLKAWNCIGYLYMAGLVILLCRVIMCHFSFYSMVNTINQVQIHRFESKWLRNPNKKNDEGFIFSSHSTNQAKDNFSQSIKNTFVDSNSNCIYRCLTLLAYQIDK